MTPKMGLLFQRFILVFAALISANVRAQNTELASLDAPTTKEQRGSMLSAARSAALSSSAPLQTEDQFLFSQGRLSGGNHFAVRDAAAPDFYFLECAASNTHNQKRGFYEVDYESYNCNFRYEGSVKDKFRYYFSAGIINTGSGVFDSAIRNWHDAFSMPNGPRNENNQNEYTSEGRLAGDARFSIDKESFGVLDPSFGLSVPVHSFSEQSGLYFETSASVPLGLSNFSLSKPDLRSSLVLSNESGWTAYVVGITGSIQLDRVQHGISYQPVRYAGFISSIVPLGESWSILLGATVSSSAVANAKRFPTYAWYIDTGVRYSLSEGSRIVDIILRENPSPDDGSVDVSLFARFGF